MTTIAVVGGTGALGTGLAARLQRAGHSVIIGSRDAAKAAAAAAEFAGGAAISGMANRDAAAAAEVVFVTVPFASQADTLADIKEACAGKIVIDTTVPLVPPKVAKVQLPAEGSAAAIAQAALGEGVRLATGFHNVSAAKLAKGGDVGCDVLIFSDDREAANEVIALVDQLEVRGVYGGVLANSAAAEAMTSVLIQINRTYKVPDGAGIRVAGL